MPSKANANRRHLQEWRAEQQVRGVRSAEGCGRCGSGASSCAPSHPSGVAHAAKPVTGEARGVLRPSHKEASWLRRRPAGRAGNGPVQSRQAWCFPWTGPSARALRQPLRSGEPHDAGNTRAGGSHLQPAGSQSAVPGRRTASTPMPARVASCLDATRARVGTVAQRHSCSDRPMRLRYHRDIESFLNP